MHYDPRVDALWIELRSRGTTARIARVQPGINIDFDAKGRCLGIEILDASFHLSPAVLREVRESSR